MTHPSSCYFVQLSLFVGWYWRGQLVVAVDDDGNEEDTDDKDIDNDGDDLSSLSILFSKMKLYINGSAILRNDCVLYSESIQTWGGV
jgi:hypothetical protein